MKTIFVLLALVVSNAASAACYMILTPKNEVVWQGSSAPVAMDKVALDAEVQRLVPNGHLVIAEVPATACITFDLTDRAAAAREKTGKTKFE